jgi:transketolase
MSSFHQQIQHAAAGTQVAASSGHAAAAMSIAPMSVFLKGACTRKRALAYTLQII